MSRGDGILFAPFLCVLDRWIGFFKLTSANFGRSTGGFRDEAPDRPMSRSGNRPYRARRPAGRWIGRPVRPRPRRVVCRDACSVLSETTRTRPGDDRGSIDGDAHLSRTGTDSPIGVHGQVERADIRLSVLTEALIGRKRKSRTRVQPRAGSMALHNGWNPHGSVDR